MTDLVAEWRDSSGYISISLFTDRSSMGSVVEDFEIEVEKDMVCIGGGARVASDPYNALLTASYPSDDLSKWIVSSKDHIIPQQHRLEGFALGLKIADDPPNHFLSRDQLLANIKPFKEVSSAVQHPYQTASVEFDSSNDYLLLNGGFKVNYTDGKGNLATCSSPKSAFSWKARSKDMDIEDPSTIEVYAIGIKRILPGQIEVVVSYNSERSNPEAHPSSIASPVGGFALCGGGAEVHYNVGNYLWSLEPAINEEDGKPYFIGRSKDHIHSDHSRITTFAMGMKIRR
jgi:hypothetical protein